MTTVAVSIPETNTRDWIEAVANMKNARDLEVSADALEETEVLSLATRYGLFISAVRDLLTPEIGRYFCDIPRAAHAGLVPLVGTRVRNSCEAGARLLSLRLGLERIGREREEHEIAARVAFLRRLATSLDSQGATLSLPVRYPLAFPASREWDLAINILHDLMHPSFRISLDIFPSELPPDFDPGELFRKIGFHLGCVRLVYEPLLGEEISVDFLQRWIEGLRWHGFKGVLAFAPKVQDADYIREICRGIDQAAAALLEQKQVAE